VDELIAISENGTIQLPTQIILILLKASKIRSRRKRQIKKSIKKQFIKIFSEICDNSNEK